MKQKRIDKKLWTEHLDKATLASIHFLWNSQTRIARMAKNKRTPDKKLANEARHLIKLLGFLDKLKAWYLKTHPVKQKDGER